LLYLWAVGAAVTWALYSVLARCMRVVPTRAVIGYCAASTILAAVAHAPLTFATIGAALLVVTAGWIAASAQRRSGRPGAAP
jgi:drug/metabolite transporter (DMT)-like permease